MNMARKAHRVTDVWAGASRAFKGYTQKHTPLLWEMMLGTVYAKAPGEYESTYFDYDYEAAHAHIQLDKYEDLRVCKVKYAYQGWPRQGKWALFGVYVETEAELRDKVTEAERTGGGREYWMKKLLACQLKNFNKAG
jgi:hypothetical protein